MIKKFALELKYPEAETDLIIYFIEKIRSSDFNKNKEKKEGKLIKYIQTIMINGKINLFRKNVLKDEENIELNPELVQDCKSDNMDKKIILEEVLHLVTNFQKNILLYKYIEGYSEKEISNKMNISRQAINRAKNRAFEKIKSEYKEIF